MTRNAEHIVLGVDLDGVCADFYGRMRTVAAEWFERPVDELTEDVSWGLREWGIKPGQYDSLHRFAVTARELFKTTPMIPGARKVLRRLSDEKYRIRIITHRLFIQYFHAIAVQQTIEWLDHHGLPYWDLCFMKDKGQVGADIYIEDSPEHVKELRARGLHTICFANSTNKDVAPPRARTGKRCTVLLKNGAVTPIATRPRRHNPLQLAANALPPVQRQIDPLSVSLTARRNHPRSATIARVLDRLRGHLQSHARAQAPTRRTMRAEGSPSACSSVSSAFSCVLASMSFFAAAFSAVRVLAGEARPPLCAVPWSNTRGRPWPACRHWPARNEDGRAPIAAEPNGARCRSFSCSADLCRPRSPGGMEYARE
jgi:5'(3')-deoxyribonucleotidase